MFKPNYLTRVLTILIQPKYRLRDTWISTLVEYDPELNTFCGYGPKPKGAEEAPKIFSFKVFSTTWLPSRSGKRPHRFDVIGLEGPLACQVS